MQDMEVSTGEVPPPGPSIAGSGHLQTTHLHLSFCISDVFVKQLDVSELDRSALLRS